MPKELKSDNQGARMDAKLAHNNTSIIAFVRDGDIWLADTNSFFERRATFTRKG